MNQDSLGQQYFHHLEPDYTKSIFELPPDIEERIREKLTFLYGAEKEEEYFGEVLRTLQVYYAHKSDEMLKWEADLNPEDRFTEKDAILITYGDLVKTSRRGTT